MFEIGSSLRRARERLGLELPQVAEQTRIRAKYLRALEEEQFDVLPGSAYAKGFLRVYADFLGLQGERFVDEFNERFPPADVIETAPLVRVRPRRHWLSARLVIIPVALSLALFTWHMTTGGSGGQHHIASAPQLPHVRVSAAATTTAPAPAPKPAAPSPQAARLALVATRGTCWLSVRRGSQSGPLISERTLQLGEKAQFTGTRLWVRLGAPWNVDAKVDGRHLALPSAIGDIVVTP